MSQPLGLSEDLSKRILFLLGALIVFRLGTHITIPFISGDALASLVQDQQGTILDMFNMFSGGALERLSIFTLGIMPYISASIIVTLMTSVIPKLEQLKKEGETGKRKITQYTRMGTVISSVPILRHLNCFAITKCRRCCVGNANRIYF